MSILVCGGAGYIGSHMVAYLLEQNIDVIILDSLITGHKESLMGGKLYIGDIQDEILLDKVFFENKIEGVIDFAAFSLVSESMTDPIKYFSNNVIGTISLVKSMIKNHINNFIFSSTASTYGEPNETPIAENHSTLPTNTYGETKLVVENFLKWCSKAYNFKYTALRYFNAAGAHHNGKIGESHNCETHLIPIIIETVLGKRDTLYINGNDFDTRDGTCIRDYIHVEDLATAHLLALRKLQHGGNSAIFNLGSGTGYSILEVVNTVTKVTNTPINYSFNSRRIGDPSILVASCKKAKAELNWIPKYTTLESIIESAWAWHKSHPEGYTNII